MQKFVIPFIVIPFLAFAQDFEFEQEWDSIQLEVDSLTLAAGWTGGYTRLSPECFDVDADEDKDIFIGSASDYLHSYLNVGTSNLPVFTFDSDQYAGINCSEYIGFLNPVICDIDADQDGDLFIGTGGAVIRFYQNVGTAIQPVYELAADTLRDESGEWIWGEHPDWADIDADGDYDLFCGRWTGTIRYYNNIGDSTQYILHLVTEEFANINFGLQNNADPTFCDIDADSVFDLFVGNRYGKIYFYQNNGTPGIYNFADPVINWLNIDVGDYASPEFCDIDGDGDYDLFIGKDNYDDYTTPGALHFWENIGDTQNPNFVEVSQSYLTFDAGPSSMVDLGDIDLDGDLDLFFQTYETFGWMENIGFLENPSFVLQTYNLLGVTPGAIDFADLNGDSSLDLVTADGWGGTLTLWRNTGIPGQLSFEEISEISTDYVINDITLADMDADEDVDLLLGGFENIPSNLRLVYYENQGTSQQPNFVWITDDYLNILQTLNLPSISPTLSDVDIDSDYDLLFLDVSTSFVYLYENVGGPQTANMVQVSQDFLGYDLDSPPRLDCGDIDDDGDMDVFAGVYEGGIMFFRNVTGQNEVGPRRPYIPYPKLDFAIGPNPANPVTWISFSLPAPQEATLAVYNILGAKVTTLASDLHMPGTHNVIWNASQYSSGVYIIRLETLQFTSSQRVMVVK